jgi:large subunit ribosomal protein L24
MKEIKKEKAKLKIGDLVKVISGGHKGVIDYISKINLEEKRVFLSKIKRTKYDVSSAEAKKKSETKEVMIPIHISNVSL